MNSYETNENMRKPFYSCKLSSVPLGGRINNFNSVLILATNLTVENLKTTYNRSLFLPLKNRIEVNRNFRPFSQKE